MGGGTSARRKDKLVRTRAIRGILSWGNKSRGVQIEYAELLAYARACLPKLEEPVYDEELDLIVDRAIHQSIDTLPVDDIDGLEEYLNLIVGL